MKLSCNLYVDGNFEGLIDSNQEINVGKNGHIKGDVVAKKVIVQGYIEGTINAEKVEIKEAGRVSGTIESAEFLIESQGVFEGNSVVKSSSSAPKTISQKTQLSKS